ncbi:response regulator [Acetobacterium paludosum]|uniref:Stage 0 sporulation protein A homolog n=1 Tax=Acetobacterium paludosum TaxID=52693 RepID=A0A923KWW5_9FIRM|nr:response regulator transcription factor [Acetobacterium paludosum]MBC3888860.1 response regulator [Acetobacterium paludosum]
MQNIILIVDDEPDIVGLLQDYFEINDYQVMTAENGEEAINKAEKQPDLIILDINMPDMDGLEVCKKIRDFIPCPILFLTAKVEESDKINGFQVGGDDYIEKPFSIDELGARVEAHLRRENRNQVKTKTKFDGNLVIDYMERGVYYCDEFIFFAKKEFDIIELLSMNRGQVFDKERIYEGLWGWESEGDSSVVVEHIRRIRGKFIAAGSRQYIETVWGVGYKWVK